MPLNLGIMDSKGEAAGPEATPVSAPPRKLTFSMPYVDDTSGDRADGVE